MIRSLRLSVAAVVSLGVLAAACDGPRGSAQLSDAPPKIVQSAYQLTAGDKVKITVFNEPDLSGEFQVNDSGHVALPLAGEVPAAERTLPEFKNEVIKTLRGRFVKNPRVAVEVMNYRPFNVIGEVRNAGQYPYRPGLTVQDAVAMAGGYTYRANTRTLYVRRTNAGGEDTVQTDSDRAPVLPGDNIRVPERYF
jgi:polysaccharide export outer membrane protein